MGGSGSGGKFSLKAHVGAVLKSGVFKPLTVSFSVMVVEGEDPGFAGHPVTWAKRDDMDSRRQTYLRGTNPTLGGGSGPKSPATEVLSCGLP